ncbi:MAG: hypothetical protein ACXAB2_02410 [Candidatus Hodarchaeales archaeon]|jgi:hypothetical protein
MNKRILLGVSFLLLVLGLGAVSVQGASMPDVDTLYWHSKVKSGAEFSWDITTVTTNASGTSWTWIWGNDTVLTQGEKITYTYDADLDVSEKPGDAGPLNLTGLTVTVGDVELLEEFTFLSWFIFPLYVNNTLNQVVSVNAMEALFFNTYNFDDAYPYDWRPTEDWFPSAQHQWNLDVNRDQASLDNIGANAEKDATFDVTVVTPNAWPADNDAGYGPDIALFDCTYDSASGFMTKLVYPSTATTSEGRDATNSTYPLTSHLDAMVIDFDGNPPSFSSAPGFEAPIVVTGLFLFATLVVIRRRK